MYLDFVIRYRARAKKQCLQNFQTLQIYDIPQAFPVTALPIQR